MFCFLCRRVKLCNRKSERRKEEEINEKSKESRGFPLFESAGEDDPPSPTSEYGSARFENLNVENYGDSQGSDSEVVLVSIDGHILTAPMSAAEQQAENLRLNTPQFHLAPGDGTEFCEGNTEFASSETSWETAILIDNKEGGIIETEDQVHERVSIDSTREDNEQPTPSKPTEEDNENEKTMDSVATTSCEDLGKHATDLRYELSLCKDELRQGMGLSAAAKVFDAHRISMKKHEQEAIHYL